MENLPEEMLTEILAKLSVNSAMRMSCVCKSLCDLIIRNPYLGEKQFKNSVGRIKDRSLIFLTCTANKYLLSSCNPSALIPHQLPTVEFSQVLGSCNGIICLSANNNRVYLYNPITREEKRLPPNISSHGQHLTGFGFDKSCNDFKVIRIYDEHVEVYRLSTNEWSVIDLNLKTKYHFSFLSNGVFLNGFYHWLVEKRQPYSEKILTFDLHNETFGEMNHPKSGWFCAGIGVLDESLAVWEKSLVDGIDLEFWVMTEYGKKESWMKKFSIRTSPAPRSKVAFWVHNMEIVLLGHYARDGKSVIAYFTEGGGCTPLIDFHCSCWITGAVFQPTLVSLRR